MSLCILPQKGVRALSGVVANLKIQRIKHLLNFFRHRRLILHAMKNNRGNKGAVAGKIGEQNTCMPAEHDTMLMISG